MLKFLRAVSIRFNPADPTATSARELLQRVGSTAAIKSNPDCKVSFRVLEPACGPAGSDDGADSGVALEFSDGERRELRARDYTVADFVRVIEEKATAMELKQVLTECKFDPQAAAAEERKQEKQQQQQQQQQRRR
jgi:hypothetical protein